MALPVHGSTQRSGNAGTTSLDITSVAVTGTDPTLVVKVAYKDNAGGEIISVVWDAVVENQALTQIGTEERNGNANSSLWSLAVPVAKTATVTISLTNSVRIVGAASVYTGVDQTNPFRTVAVAQANGNSASPTVDVVALNDEMVVDSLAQVSAGPDSALGDHTERHDFIAIGGGDDTKGASQEKASTGATETMGWTMGGSDNWAVVAAPLQEPQAAPATSPYYFRKMGQG